MKRLILVCIAWYQRYGAAALAAFLPFGAISGCRQIPSCSAYAHNEIEERGVLRGGARALRRVVLCNPLTSHVH